MWHPIFLLKPFELLLFFPGDRKLLLQYASLKFSVNRLTTCFISKLLLYSRLTGQTLDSEATGTSDIQGEELTVLSILCSVLSPLLCTTGG